MTKRLVCVLVLALASLLTACTGYRPPPGYDVCNVHPGTWDCQVEQYNRVDSF